MLCIFLWNSSVVASDYVIAVNSAYSGSEAKDVVVNLFNTMYAPLGIEPEIRFYPSKRGLQLANLGQVDAEAGRVPLVAKRYADLIVVPEPMIEHKVAYFCLEKSYCQKDEHFRYAIIAGFQAGNAYCETNDLSCLYDQSHSFLSNALINKAVDALIGGKMSILNLLCNRGIERIYYRVAKDIEIVSYHLIHKRHATFIEPLSSSIKSMHQSGAFDEFVEETTGLPANCGFQLIQIH